MNKNRQVIRELHGFFKNNDSTRAMYSITVVLNKLLIVEVINVIAAIFELNVMPPTKQILSNDKQIREKKQAFDKLAHSV